MKANSMCIACMLGKQEKQIRPFSDENKKSDYMHRVLEILYRHGRTESAPWLAEQIDQLYESFWGKKEDYSQIRHRYNQLLLEKESEIVRQIRGAKDPIEESIKYVCAANYIDFSAVEHVTEDGFEKLLEKAGSETVPQEEYQAFRKDLAKARRAVYLTDNCGEIVLDKVFIRFLKESFPCLQITVIVRGMDVINDATMEDAREVGLTDLVPCVGNGNGAPGTVLKRLGQQTRRLLLDADLVIAKGQGNFESLYGEGLNPYYMFLCKCELFVRRFGFEQYKSIFVKESSISL